MSELLVIMNDFSVNHAGLMTWGISGLIIILGLLLQRKWIKEYICEWQLNHLLKNIGVKSLQNVSVPDGIDSNIFIEYLILTPEKIILLAVKRYRGLIFAADKIDLWTQVVGNKSYKFSNPLRQLENDTISLNSILEHSKVEGKVLFINGSEFPKGKPDNIITIPELKKLDDESSSDIPEALKSDWEHLIELSESNNLNKGILIEESHSSGLNFFYLMSVVIGLALWLVWRLK